MNNLIDPLYFQGCPGRKAKEINEAMKVAAANYCKFSKANCSWRGCFSYGGDRPRYGKDYIIPSTFDPRLISVIPAAVAEAAMKSGVARKNIDDLESYKDQLTNRRSNHVINARN